MFTRTYQRKGKEKHTFRFRVPSMRTGMILFSVIFAIGFSYFCVSGSSNVTSTTIAANNHELTARLLSQSRKLFDEPLYNLLEQLITLSNDSSLRKVMISLSGSTNSTPSASSYVSMDKSLANIFTYNSQLLDSIVVCLNNRAVFYKAQNGLLSVKVDFAEWYEKYQDNECHWLNYHPVDNITYRKAYADQKTYSVLKMLGSPDSTANAYIIFNIRKDYFDRMMDFDFDSDSVNQSLALVSEDGVSYFGTTTIDISKDLQSLILRQETTAGQISCDINNEMVYINYDTLNTNGWKIINCVSEKEMLMEANKAQKRLMINGLLLSFVFVAATAFSTMCLTQPLHQLSERVSKAGSEPVVFDIRSQYEIAVLNDNIADMMERIQELNQRVNTELNRKRELEISSLQAQINPHFLYNTLYDVQQLCVIGDMDLAAEMVSDLAQFYRTGLSRGRQIITLREELTHVESYLHIQMHRYTNVFTYEVRIPEQFMDMKVPKLTIQPIVENAIYHGIKPKLTNDGLIIIEAETENESVLLIKVSDNGVGIDADNLKRILEEINSDTETRKGYGMHNVHNRLRLQLGAEYGITIKSEVDVGTVVVIRLPILAGEAEI